jgi:hypothetical protein
MTIYAKLLTTLDQQFIFHNRVSSRVRRIQQGFDYQTLENIIVLEYRVKVDGGWDSCPDPQTDDAKRLKQLNDRQTLDAIWDGVLREMGR